MQPINDHNDGSGYWYSLWQMSDGHWGYSVRGDDDAVIDECPFTFPTKRDAVEAACLTIATWRTEV